MSHGRGLHAPRLASFLNCELMRSSVVRYSGSATTVVTTSQVPASALAGRDLRPARAANRYRGRARARYFPNPLTSISTRRFRARLSVVLLSAIGFASPAPTASIFVAATPTLAR